MGAAVSLQLFSVLAIDIENAFNIHSESGNGSEKS